MKHSELEDDRASRWWRAPAGKQCAQKSRGRRVVRPITRKGERATGENTRPHRGRTIAGIEQPVRAQGHVGCGRGAGVLVSMPQEGKWRPRTPPSTIGAPSSKGLSPRDLPSGCSEYGIGFKIVGTKIYNDTSREEMTPIAPSSLAWSNSQAGSSSRFHMQVEANPEGNTASRFCQRWVVSRGEQRPQSLVRCHNAAPDAPASAPQIRQGECGSAPPELY
jgi:hypothetical protein